MKIAQACMVDLWVCQSINQSKRVIKLPIIIGQGEHTVTIMANFLVIDQSLAYNIIISRPLTKKTNTVIMVYCLTVKFLTPTRIRYTKVDQATARQCHIQSLHLSKQVVLELDKVVTWDILAIECDGSMIMLDGLDSREDYHKPGLIEQTEEIQSSGEGRTTRIGTLLNEDQMREMGQFLRNNSNIFTWSAAEMPSISPIVIRHSLNVNLAVWPIKQKKRKFALERIKAIK